MTCSGDRTNDRQSRYVASESGPFITKHVPSKVSRSIPTPPQPYLRVIDALGEYNRNRNWTRLRGKYRMSSERSPHRLLRIAQAASPPNTKDKVHCEI